jgi:hypothetical protein
MERPTAWPAYACIVVASLALSPRASAGGDPYEGTYHRIAAAKLQRHLAQYQTEIEILYFAVGCKVLPSEADTVYLIGPHGDMIVREAIESRLPIPAAGKMMQAAKEAGLARARKPGGCSFWRQHPQAVYRIRHAVAAAEAAGLPK